MKEIFVNLLKEVPNDTVVFRTMSYSFTATDMLYEASRDTNIYKEWVSSVLRISRDMIIRQANK